MPLYEFACSRCSKSFEEIVSNDTITPICPSCSQTDGVTRVAFARVTVGKKEDLRPPFIKGVKPRR
jgi:putative FmdB family regulatory protein